MADRGRVVGVDFTPEMLVHADKKRVDGPLRPTFAHGDALAMPVHSSIADVCTVAFGIRNVAEPVAATDLELEMIAYRPRRRAVAPNRLAVLLLLPKRAALSSASATPWLATAGASR